MLTADEVFRVLGVIAAYDHRAPAPTEAEVTKWQQASRVARWPDYPAVEEAVITHYATVTYPVMPGHVTQILAEQAAERRRLAQQPPRFDRAALPPATATEAGRARAIAEYADRVARKKSMPA